MTPWGVRQTAGILLILISLGKFDIHMYMLLDTQRQHQVGPS